MGKRPDPPPCPLCSKIHLGEPTCVSVRLDGLTDSSRKLMEECKQDALDSLTRIRQEESDVQ